MRLGSTKWHCTFNFPRRCYDLYLSMKTGNLSDPYNTFKYATEISFVENDLDREIEPFLSLEQDQAQELMDMLWDAGLRPAGAAGSAGQLGAVENHLADMRKMVFESFLPTYCDVAKD